ncbi:MAG: hypothetical protein ACRDUT_06965 [Mycobacterium sp.]
MSQNMFANPTARGPLTRATLGIGVALAAIGAIGLGSGVAGAAPQQPVLVDDPIPVPTPAGTDPTSGVNIANAIFSELDALLNVVFPGSGPVFMPAGTGTSPLLPGSGNPGLVSPGQTIPGLPSYPGTVPPGYPTTIVPGQTPALPGSPTPLVPGQTPPLPVQPSPVSPGQAVPIV